MAEEIILKAEQLKARSMKKHSSNGSIGKQLTLSDVIEGYKKVMKKHGIDTMNESHYYAMIVKVSLN